MIYNLLAIAIDSYDDPNVDQLNNCQSDLAAVMTILQSKYQIDDVTLLLKRQETSKSFIYNKIYDTIINSLEGDSLILIFLGHGEYNSRIGQPYWIPADAVLSDQSTWIPVYEILSFLKQADVTHFCLIADNCYSGAIFEEAVRGGGVEAFLDHKSRRAITSGSIEKVKDGKPGEASPFNKVLCHLLEINDSDLPVNVLGNQLVMEFPKDIMQTPRSGAIHGVGDLGGSLVLKLKKVDAQQYDGQIRYKNIDLPLKVNQKIDFSCEIALFESNPVFDAAVVNVAVQNFAYEILGELRHDLQHGYLQGSKSEHLVYHIGFTVQLVSDKYVSLLVHVEGYLGGPYPFNLLESINFAVDSDRKITLREFFDAPDEEQFFTELINKYSEEGEERETLLGHVKYYELDKVKFTLNPESISLYFLDYIPKAVQCYAFLDIPLSDYKIDLGKLYDPINDDVL